MGAFFVPHELALGAIGDHSFHHLDLQLLTNAEISSEISSTKRMIEQQTREHVDLFRAPYGARDARVDKIVKRLGLLEVMWSIGFPRLTRRQLAGDHQERRSRNPSWVDHPDAREPRPDDPGAAYADVAAA
ncbi:MAG: polysaccharide deacetylase family protein [Solirubrobacteraceae bacterium]